MTGGVLLDTCALLWIAADQRVRPEALDSLDEAYAAGAPVCASPISAWEIGMLAARGRVVLTASPRAWFAQATSRPGMSLCGLDPDVLIDASYLPGDPPNDPGDRILLSTARAAGYRIMTRDRRILAYAEAGHVAAIAC
ncbi:type II toxin-antitoxin system VapC family toxin [Rubrimonas sp.]|uniref:type II toxin-antitoxin system VapC family toxin n=1 Tax=Rubrimonas sp. TaxID=2036015 RepID=UPI002FDEB5C9